MGIPETILAAGIGGAATITAAVFQLYTALRVKTKPDPRQKRASMLRSSISMAALVAASFAGGYLYAEFRQQQAIEDTRAMRDDLRGMRDEINAQLQALAQTAAHLERERRGENELPADAEALVLARGPADRACEDTTSGDRPSTCDAAAPPSQVGPVATPLASDGDF